MAGRREDELKDITLLATREQNMYLTMTHLSLRHLITSIKTAIIL